MSTYGLWLSTTGMKINELRQRIQANNLANVETPGFKHDYAVVAERVVESRARPEGWPLAHPVLDGLSGGVNVLPTHYSLEQGRVERTGRALDVAIEGHGFLAVNDGSAQRYTRDGVLSIDRSGHLVLAAGEGRWRVQGTGGGPIIVQPEGGPITISGQGEVRQGQELIGRIGVFDSDDRQGLRKVGETLFEAPEGSMQPMEAKIVSESREASTYEAMSGLIEMIESARAYQLNATMLQLQDQVTGSAISSMARVA